MLKTVTVFFIAALLLSACNSGSQQQNPALEGPKTKEDSLYRDIMDAHDVAMPKIGKLKGYISLVKHQLDSLSGLSGNAQSAATNYIASLDSLLESLQYADMAMDKWMTEFEPDSAEDDAESRMRYLESEKVKATAMKNAVLSSVEKAQQVLKR